MDGELDGRLTGPVLAGERTGQCQDEGDRDEAAEADDDPNRTFSQGVLALSPAKAEPLLTAVEMKAYITSERPRAPSLLVLTDSTSSRIDGIESVSAIPDSARSASRG